MIKIWFVAEQHMSPYRYMKWQKAEDWLERLGFILGAIKRPNGRVIARDDDCISKWGNLSPAARDRFCGVVNLNLAGDAIMNVEDGVLALQRHPDPQSLKEGDEVLLLRDDGEYECRTVKYGAWQLGHGQLVVGLHGLVGGWSADRIYVVE